MAWIRRFIAARWKTLVTSVTLASNAEKVRAVLALTLVGVLVALQFVPSDQDELTTAAETLAITVVAFYFGLHTGSGPGASTNGVVMAESGPLPEKPTGGSDPEKPTKEEIIDSIDYSRGLIERLPVLPPLKKPRVDE
jgi:hypothetical protein